MQGLLSDPWFYAACVPAVLLVGLSKGGLGGATALIGVPMMTLVLPPVQAAAIMLPILILMDIVSLWTWRGYRHTQTLFYMLPGALAGIAIGWWLASSVSTDMVKLIVGVIAGLFAGRWFWLKLRKSAVERPPSRIRGAFWGVISGYTSFVAHAGGPPFQMYALPLGLHPRTYTGTSVIYFAIVNAVKVLPYFLLGEFSTGNLMASAVLMPFAPLATLAGAWLVKRMKPEVFYPFTYTMVAIVAVKLIHDGLGALSG
ncbi:MAG: hypothetical protein CMJ42_06560 [Phyllobacteriaceae bacterium]|nr:hypothetical protein [Phyllobacteriaceae bacterium]MBA92151.1 hypothetical protein [Phyllobacteriaceae bacterium]